VCSQAGPGATLFSRHLPAHIRSCNIRHRLSVTSPEMVMVAAPVSALAGPQPGSSCELTFKAYIDQMKRTYLQHLLSETQGNIADCCRRSGLSRSQIYRLMQQHDLKTP
jgi:two-component system, NtrC family, response regulator